MFGKHKPNKTAVSAVAIELCHHTLHLAVAERQPGQAIRFHTQTVRWRHEAHALHSELGRSELAAALKQLVSRHKLHGMPLSLSLNGDFCVTRVVAGTVQRVRRRLAQIEERSPLYLSLGQGPKAVSHSIRPIDARHQHALVMVVHQATLEAVAEAVNRVGLELQRIEPSLMSVCRLVGRTQGDADAPALVVHVGQERVDLGISHRGQPLLDYRPVGLAQPADVAAITAGHLARLQRYCDRYIRFAPGRFQRLFLCGDAEAVPAVAAAFGQQPGSLPVSVLEPPGVDDQWQFSTQAIGPEMSAVVGAVLPAIDGSLEPAGPNLVEQLQAQRRGPLLPALARIAWPLAATLLLAAGFWGLRFYEQGRCRNVERRLAQYEATQSRARQLQLEIVRDQKKTEYLRRLEATLSPAGWRQVAVQIAGCLPEDVWLEQIQLDNQGQMTLSGVSFSEDGVFEFMRWLRKSPLGQQVALKGTGTTPLPSGPATSFEVLCGLAGSNDQEGTSDGEG